MNEQLSANDFNNLGDTDSCNTSYQNLGKKKMENLEKCIIGKEIETIMKYFSIEEVSRPCWCQQ